MTDKETYERKTIKRLRRERDRLRHKADMFELLTIAGWMLFVFTFGILLYDLLGVVS